MRRRQARVRVTAGRKNDKFIELMGEQPVETPDRVLAIARGRAAHELSNRTAGESIHNAVYYDREPIRSNQGQEGRHP